MSTIIEFYVAPDDEAAATVVEHGPAGIFESLSCGNFDVEEALMEWEGIFTGRRFEELVAAGEPRVVADPDDGEGPLILVVSGPLQDALAAADPLRLAEVGALWVRERAAEGEEFDLEMATELLGDLARLARAADEHAGCLYCWSA
ncbi:hypothetical protein C7C46_04090 [Streptomyces tateyamensis]|uniref:DUF1877 domain-containing protein n=2 Tax=Streptomyces tateyamensis TaxID=565073 RepID=A0A2V4PMX6_9ACTN|nr:hypothetical protein C7C46_04090 [Streptomyces tateyamensis]